MPMFAWSNSLRRDERGLAAVELAFLTPVLLAVLLIATDFGRLYYESALVERGLRAGALFAARTETPLSNADKTTAENLVKRGTVDTTAPYLVDGWSKTGASFTLQSSSYDVSGESLPVLTLTARVPFEPIFPTLFQYLGFNDDFVIQLTHVQSYVDD